MHSIINLLNLITILSLIQIGKANLEDPLQMETEFDDIIHNIDQEPNFNIDSNINIINEEDFDRLSEIDIGEEIDFDLFETEFTNSFTNNDYEYQSTMDNSLQPRFVEEHIDCRMISKNSKTQYKRKKENVNYAKSSSGVGAAWLAGDISRLQTVSCTTGASNLPISMSGSLNINLNFICIDPSTRKRVAIPSEISNCKPKVYLYFGYDAYTRCYTSGSDNCVIGRRQISVDATHEFNLKIDNTVKFSRGAICKTGNVVSSGHSLELAGNVGASIKDGPSASISAKFGVSRQSTDNLGDKRADFVIEGREVFYLTPGSPKSIFIRTNSHLSMNAEGRVHGFVAASSKAFKLCLDIDLRTCGGTFGRVTEGYDDSNSSKYEEFNNRCQSFRDIL